MSDQLDAPVTPAPARSSGCTGETDEALRPVAEFRNVDKTFADGTHALRDISFSVGPAEFVAIVGPSGCGKSTILRLAAGLIPVSGGHVQAVPNPGFVFQDATLLPWRTVQKNVELLGELHGLPSDERSRIADDAIRLVALDGFERHYPKSLSGGMKMRASLARALTMHPPLFLFDEPFGALDEITRELLNEELMRLFDSEGFAAIFITHSITEAVFLSTRVLVMTPRPGRISAQFDVPFSYPRVPDLRFSSEFGELASQVSQALRRGHQ